MPEVYHVQSLGVALMKGLDPVHLQLRNSGYGQQSLLPLPLRAVPLPDNLLRPIVFAFGLCATKAETKGWKLVCCFLYIASCI